MQHYGLPIFGHEAKEFAQRDFFASLPWCAVAPSPQPPQLLVVADRSCTGIGRAVDRAAVKSSTEIECAAARQIVPSRVRHRRRE
jgi:hypothetical protein